MPLIHYKCLKGAGLTKYFTDNCASATLSRMKELNVKRGVAKYAMAIKSIGRIVTQYIRGIMSHCTLMGILKRR